MSTTDCGTYGGYQQHKRRGEHTCQPCRDANAAYHAAHRATNPDSLRRSHQQQKLRNRAIRILASRHLRELRDIITELETAA